MKQKYNFLGKVAAYFIDRYRIVYLLILSIFALGAMAYAQLPREQAPEIPMPIVLINTVHLGVAPSEMEELVTEVIENAVKDVEGVKEINSSTSNGVSSVWVMIDEDVELRDATSDINTTVNNIRGNLPNGAMDPIIRGVNASDMPVMNVTVSGDYTLVELKRYAEDIEREIKSVTGVDEVILSGGLEPVINIYIDQDKMEAYGLNLNGIAQSIDASNNNRSVGNIELDTLEYSVKVIGKFDEIEDIENVVVGIVDDVAVYLRDIAYIRAEYQEASSVANKYDAEFDEHKVMTSTVSLRVMREGGADILRISEEIDKIIEDGKGELYPEDINVTMVNNSAEIVEKTLNEVLENALSGLIIVIIVLFIFIGIRESLIVAVVIPLSLFMTFMAMMATDITLNTLSLVALIVALGMLVDNAIVIIESIDRARDEGMNVVEAAKSASNQVAPAVFSATLTTLSAFLPIAMMKGTMGAFISTLPKVIIFAIASSFIMSVVVTPTLCARMLSKHKVAKKPPVFIRIASILLVAVLSAYAFEDTGIVIYAVVVFGVMIGLKMFFVKQEVGSENGLKRVYGAILHKILNQKIGMVALLIGCIVLFVNSVMVVVNGKINIELIPTGETTTISIQGQMPSGYLLEDATEIAEQMENTLFKYDEIINIGSNVQKSDIDITIEIEDVENVDIFVDQLRTDLSMIPGVKITLAKQEAFAMASGTDSEPISVRISGESDEDIEQVVRDLTEIMDGVEGTTEVSSSMGTQTPELRIVVDKEKASLYGLSVDIITGVIYQRISDTDATTIILDGEEIDVKLKYDDADISSVMDFEDVVFKTQFGEIPFNEVAHIEEVMAMSTISHRNLDRVETVNSNVMAGYNAVSVLNNFQEQIADYELPSGVTISYGGEMESIIELFTSLFISMGVAIVLVLIILTVQFNSLTQPAMILCAVPLAIIGSIGGLLITGNNFGGFALLGIVALVGIAINNAIVLVDYANYLRKTENIGIKEAVVEASKSRLVSVLSTTITTIGGMLPLALKDPIYAQLSYALIFGLLAATILTLVIIPTLYYIFESIKVRIRRKIPVLVDER